MIEFHFIRPLWLLSVLPLLFLIPLWRKAKREQFSLQQMVAPHLLTHLRIERVKSIKNPLWLMLVCWLIASIAAAGPSWQKRQAPVFSTERAQVILMDMNMATRATDVAPDRHSLLKFKAQDLIQGLTEGQTGLVAYAGDAFTIAPLTRDPDNLTHLLTALSPEVMPIAGHDPVAGFREAHQLLSQAGMEQADIFWLTGSIDRTHMEDIRQFLRQHSYRVSIIAAGTNDGAPVRAENGELLRTPQGALIIPRLIPSYLEQISNDTGGIFARLDPESRDIEALLALRPLTLDSAVQDSLRNYDEWVDFAPYLALLLLPLLILLARQLQLFSVFLPLFIVGLVSVNFYSPASFAQAQANTQTEPLSEPALSFTQRLTDFFRNPQQRALSAYQQQRFAAAAEAAERTDNAMLQGMAGYRAGDYERASRYFEQLDTAEAHYNKGNSLAQAGALESAIKAYEQALQQRPDWLQAAENKALVEELLQQQQEQEQEQNQQSQQEDSEREQSEQDRDTQSEQSQSDSEAQEAQQEEQEQQEQSESDAHPEPQEPVDTEALEEAWDNLSDEEKAQLEQLLRRIPDDPAFLLRNRLRIEAQKRRGQRFN